jgi:hypothetical protein
MMGDRSAEAGKSAGPGEVEALARSEAAVALAVTLQDE